LAGDSGSIIAEMVPPVAAGVAPSPSLGFGWLKTL
jgi:hypothetical protein